MTLLCLLELVSQAALRVCGVSGQQVVRGGRLRRQVSPQSGGEAGLWSGETETTVGDGHLHASTPRPGRYLCL